MRATGIWILAELEGGLPARITFELLAAGRAIADALQEPLGALLLGAGAPSFAGQFIALGADRVLVAAPPAEAPESLEVPTDRIAAALLDVSPGWLLTGHTRLGAELAGRLAVRLESGLVTACTHFEVEAGAVMGCRPLPQGGMARALALGTPGIYTLQPGHQAWPAEQPDRTGEVTPVEVAAEPVAARLRLLDLAPDLTARLATADAMVVGGLGMGGPEHWHLVERLAALLGAATGATRGAVEAGWRPASELVGMSGRTVSPRLYVALGVRGSDEHLAGLQGDPFVVAVNRDAAAPIMRRADLAVCADARELLPALIAALEAPSSDRS